MPRFFLNLRNDEELLEDEDGQDFPSLADAEHEAVLSAREIMSARVTAGREPDHSRFEITDASGQLVLMLPFQESVQLRRRRQTPE